MEVDITFRVRFLCGCEETMETIAILPNFLANAERNAENDEKIIEYLNNNYDLTRLHCHKRHRYGHGHGHGHGELDRIVEIL